MRTRRVAAAKWVAILLGMTNAAVTGYWLAGGTALLSTVGGKIEEWGRQRSSAVLIVLAVVLLVKAGVAGLPIVLDRVRALRVRNVGRGLAWTAAVVLTLYGGLLTVVGLMVQAGVVDESSDADYTALAWHAFLWDPWFLAWGIALGSWLRLSNRPAHPGPSVSIGSGLCAWSRQSTSFPTTPRCRHDDDDILDVCAASR